MAKIKKYLPYLLIPLDIFALLALQNFSDCANVKSKACDDGSPTLVIILFAAAATASFFYKRYKAKQPLLPSFFSLKYDKLDKTDLVSKTITPLENRIFFGFCSLMMMMSYFVTVYHYTRGSDTPPYPHWAFYAIPVLIGLVLITLKDEIKIRLHPFWTSFGLLYVAFAWAIVIFIDLPQGAASGYSVFDSLGEGFWFATGFGLMLAFVGLNSLYKRIYYFIPLAFFGVVFGAIEFVNQMGSILRQKPIEWDAFLDLTWLAGGYFVAYLLVVRLIKDRPPVKIMAKATGLVLLLFLLNAAMSRNIISKAFPLKSWQHHWLKGYLPYYQFQCGGLDCGNVIYAEPFSFCVDGSRINRGNPVPFYDVAQDRATKNCQYDLNTDFKNLKTVCSHQIAGVNASSVDLPLVECGGVEFEGIYHESGINRLRQKELYD